MQLAIALQNADFLDMYVTRLYTSWEKRPFSWFNWLPQKTHDWIETEWFLKTRHHDPLLNPGKVTLIDTEIYLGMIALRRLRLISTKQWGELLHRTSVNFQEKIADIAQEKKCHLVCYDRFAYHAFDKYRAAEGKLILDLSVAHPLTARRLLDEELSLSPQFKESLNLAAVTSSEIQQTAQEAALADYILAGSNFVKSSCVENGIPPEKIFVLPYGTDMVHLEPVFKEPEDKLILLFAGQIGQRKGIRYLFDALGKLSLPQIELWLCGNFWDNNETLQPYNHLFKYLGYIPYQQMPSIYSQIDVFVLPTLLEGLSQVCLEAMARGKPVITTPNSGMEGIIRDGEDGFMIPIRDSDALAEKILFFYENREFCRKMGENARERIKQYTWENYRNQAQKIFTQILGNEST